MSSLAPECPAHLRQHLIMFLFGDFLEDVAMNVGDAPVGQGVIVIKFRSVRGIICHIIAYVHINHLNALRYVAQHGERGTDAAGPLDGTFGQEGFP